MIKNKEMTQWEKITSKDIRNIIAVMLVIGCFILVYLLLIKEIPTPNRDVVMVAVGAIIAKLGDVTGYFFGSSKTDTDRAKKESEQ